MANFGLLLVFFEIDIGKQHYQTNFFTQFLTTVMRDANDFTGPLL